MEFSFIVSKCKAIYKKIYRCLLKPILVYKVSFCFYAVLIFLPELFTVVAHDRLDYFLTHTYTTVLLAIGIAYFLCLLTLLVRRIAILEKAFLILFHAFIYLVSFVDIFLQKIFDFRINVNILTMMAETNSRESSEFLSVYCANRVFVQIVLLFVVIGSVEYVLSKINASRPHFIKSAVRWTLPLVLLVFTFGEIYSNLPFFMGSAIENHKSAYGRSVSNAEAWHVNQAILLFKDSRKDLARCAKAQNDLRIECCSYRSANVVCLIGESFNRHHSNLYGYQVNTNPKLSTLSNLYTFTDVISSINSTHLSFRNFLSMSSVDDSLSWSDAPFFLSLYRKCGYNVTFYSNQFIHDPNANLYDFSGNFYLNDPELEPLLFSHRNSEKYQYDGELIEHFREDRRTMECDSMNLTFVHFNGQHVDPVTNFPASAAYFTSDSIPRPDLTKEERQQVANYDNATRYNDSLLYEVIQMYQDKDAIILCFADHGDEANDYRSYIGRSLDFKTLGAPCMHQQLDIPFWIYVTDLYKERHPDVIQQIEKALNRPFMTDDLPHIMLYLAGIHSRWYNPQRNLLSDDYNEQRHRLIFGSNEVFDYDEICGRP